MTTTAAGIQGAPMGIGVYSGPARYRVDGPARSEVIRALVQAHVPLKETTIEEDSGSVTVVVENPEYFEGVHQALFNIHPLVILEGTESDTALADPDRYNKFAYDTLASTATRMTETRVKRNSTLLRECYALGADIYRCLNTTKGLKESHGSKARVFIEALRKAPWSRKGVNLTEVSTALGHVAALAPTPHPKFRAAMAHAKDLHNRMPRTLASSGGVHAIAGPVEEEKSYCHTLLESVVGKSYELNGTTLTAYNFMMGDESELHRLSGVKPTVLNNMAKLTMTIPPEKLAIIVDTLNKLGFTPAGGNKGIGSTTK